MAEDFRKRNDAENNQQHSGNGKDIVGKNKSLLRQVRGLQTWRLRLRSWRRPVRLWHWQLCRGDSRNRGERDSYRRNGLGGGGGGRGIEVRGDFGKGPAAPGF